MTNYQVLIQKWLESVHFFAENPAWLYCTCYELSDLQ